MQDHWKSVDPWDNRRYYGNLYLQALGQKAGASLVGLYSILSEWPICNDYTTSTTIMHPKDYTMQSYDVYVW